MYYVMDAHSFYNFIYFILLIIVSTQHTHTLKHTHTHKCRINSFSLSALFSQIGSFFMINLCLVVIATQFSETKQREHQLMQEQRAACLSSSTLTEPGDCYEEIFQLVRHVLRKTRRRIATFCAALCHTPPQRTSAHRKHITNGGQILQNG